MRLNVETRQVIRAAAGTIINATIDTPVPYVDLALPDGFQIFEILLSGMLVSALDSIAFGLSQDGGASFINDTTNFDSYKTAYLNFASGNSTSTVVNFNGELIYPASTHEPTSKLSYMTWLRLDVGTTSTLPMVMHEAISDSGSATMIRNIGNTCVNPDATIPPDFKRVNFVRFLPAATGEIVPTSGETINGGSYTVTAIG